MKKAKVMKVYRKKGRFTMKVKVLGSGVVSILASENFVVPVEPNFRYDPIFSSTKASKAPNKGEMIVLEPRVEEYAEMNLLENAILLVVRQLDLLLGKKTSPSRWAYFSDLEEMREQINSNLRINMAPGGEIIPWYSLVE